MLSAAESAPMSWQVIHCLDFGYCFDYPKEYWLSYFRTLRNYGYNGAMLWVSGTMPASGFEETLAWRCDHVPEIVDYLHSLDMRVWLASGVFGWLGMSPGLIRMRPETEITWPNATKDRYPLDTTRRGLCPTRAWDLALDYLESLYRACPQADGMALEVFCEKPHCLCEACRDAGHWRLETDFLLAATERLWAFNPEAEVIWPFGYERTHGRPPESRLYQELAKIDDPRIVWWQTRIRQGYVDEVGRRHEWLDPEELRRFAPRLLVLDAEPEVSAAARQAGALGVAANAPAGRYMFLPEEDPRHFGFFVEAPAPVPPVNSHVLFLVTAFRVQTQCAWPDWTPELFERLVRRKFFSADDPDAEEMARGLLLLEDLVVTRRVCAFRSDERFRAGTDGREDAALGKLTPEDLDRLRAVADLPKKNLFVGDMIRCAQALLNLAEG